tara:strand:- start:3 stop:458 length:456 start_codon:yes stop_codon:yes gene_type:complete
MKWLELKIPPLLAALIFGFLIWVMQFQVEIDNTIVLYIVSIILFSIGSIVSILGVWEFRKQKTTVNPMSPQESNSLVMKGIYTFTRNPMYLGFLLWLFSLGVLLRNPISLIAIVLFVIYMNIFQIIPEENILEEKFGKEYLKYKENVRRWL